MQTKQELCIFAVLCLSISQIPEKRPINIEIITNSFVVKKALVGFLALHWSFVFSITYYMRYNHLTIIKSIEDVEQFVKYIYEELGVNFHPDDDFNDIINHETGKNLFSNKDAEIYNKLVDACFDACENNNIDFYEIALKYHPIIQLEQLA